jgi:hypothetical protein
MLVLERIQLIIHYNMSNNFIQNGNEIICQKCKKIFTIDHNIDRDMREHRCVNKIVLRLKKGDDLFPNRNYTQPNISVIMVEDEIYTKNEYEEELFKDNDDLIYI